MSKKIIAVVLVLLLAVAAYWGYRTFISPKGEAGQKHVTVHVVISKEDINEKFEYTTDHEFLYDLLKEKEKELAGRVQIVKEKLKNTLNREPTINEIANELGCQPEEIVHAMEASRMPSSIYDVIYEDEDNPILLIDKIHQDSNQMGKLIDRILLKEMLLKLDKRERAIIIMRYFQDRTQSDIANKLGISQVQVSRIERKVLSKMRKML
jgi:RNA polymerase sigma factor (sigma-70 family)